MNVAHDLASLLAAVPELDVVPGTSGAAAEAAMRPVDMLNGSMLGLVRFSGETPWEIHRDGDELLHVLEGEVEVIVLTEDGPLREVLHAGSVFVVGKNSWHRQHARPTVALLFSTPTAKNEHSWADDPRVAAT